MVGDAKGPRVYLPQIDGLRFIACLLVFVHHFPAPVAHIPVLNFFKSTGWVGVDLFFAISAFLFTILLHAEQKETGAVNVPQFYTRRILRIVPLYYFFLTVMILLFVTDAFWTRSNTLRTLGAYLFIDNLTSAARGGWSQIPYSVHLWSLSFEMQLYAVVPFVYRILSRMRMRTIFLVFGVVTLLAWGGRGLVMAAGWEHPTIWMLHLLRPESILAGFLVAIAITRGYGASPGVTRVARAIGLAALLVMIALFAAGMEIHGYGWWQFVIYLAVGVMMGALVFEAAGGGALADILGTGMFRYLGKVSYGIYVFHVIGIAAAVAIFGYFGAAPASVMDWIRCFLLALSMTIVMASISYYLLERPFLRMKERYAAVLSRPA